MALLHKSNFKHMQGGTARILHRNPPIMVDYGEKMRAVPPYKNPYNI